jgi:hypothetical protein
MSFYATITGTIEFAKSTECEKAKALLKDGGWIKDGFWIDETGAPSEPFTDGLMRIEIPLSFYRNLFHLISAICAEASSWDILWASSDGTFEGGAISNGGDKTIALDEWAKAQGITEPTSIDESFDDEMSQWREDVLNEFIADPGDF